MPARRDDLVAEIAGVPIHAVSIAGAVDRLLHAAVAGESLVVHLCNAYVLSLAAGDPEYRRMLAAGDLNLADGAPVAWTLRRLGLPLVGERPSGPDVFAATLARSDRMDVAHYLYGASPATVERLATTIARQWPGTRVVGAESPPYRPLTETEYRELVERLHRTGADIVWVATGTPKQDQLIDRLRADSGVVLVAVGAAFDLVAGTKRRAPRFLRRLGLEWAFRLATEPRRLWKRYLVGNVRFLLAARRASVRSARS